MNSNHRTRSLFVLSLGLVGVLGGASGALAQQAPAEDPPGAYGAAEPQPYAPPQQVYTGDVYEQPYQGPPTQPVSATPRRVVVPYDDGMPIPEGGYVRSRSRKGLWIPGLAIFAASYFVTAGVGSLTLALRDGTSNNGQPWVPIVGGFLVANTPGGRRAAAFSVLAQSAGLTLFIAGLAARRRELVYYTDSGRGLLFGAAPLRGGGMLSLTVF